jgi:hypothetical protein
VSGRRRRELGFAWAALALGALAWFAGHQVGSNLTFARCDLSGGLSVAVVGLVALLLMAAGFLLSRRVRRSGDSAEGHRFIALVGMLAALLFAFAIVLQTVAGFIIPACFG